MDPKGSILHPLINRNKVKLSYRYLPNMGSTISKHNKKILKNDQYVARCQCKHKPTCPIPEKCATDKVIYRATVNTPNDVEIYVGLTAGSFKARFSKHKSDFNLPDKHEGDRIELYIKKVLVNMTNSHK